MQKLKKLLAGAVVTLGIVIGILLVVGLGCTLVDVIPDNAQVIIDDTAKMYHTPHHRFFEGRFEDNHNLRISTLHEARALQYTSDHPCMEEFRGEDVSLLNVTLRRWGITHYTPRVNPNGTWNF